MLREKTSWTNVFNCFFFFFMSLLPLLYLKFLITSSQQWIKLPKSTCFLWTKPFYGNKLKKKACSCQYYVEIKANDANGCYPLRSMERIGSLKNNYISLHFNIRIRHRNQSLDQYYKNLACGYLPPSGVLKLLKTPFILLESDDRLFAYRVYNRRILSCCKHI